MTDARRELLMKMADLCEKRAAMMERFCREAIAPYDAVIDTLKELLKAPQVPEEPQPTEEEQRILDVLEDGSILTGAQIGALTGDGLDNGTFRNRLAAMVKRGLLINKRPGYALPPR